MKKILNTLYIITPDKYLALDGENVIVTQNDIEVVRVPLHNLDSIITSGYTGASPALMSKCAKEGIDLVFVNSNGRFLARICGEINGNVLLRRQQFRLADDQHKSLEIAKNIVTAKIFNSRWVVERMTRDHQMRIEAEKFKEKSAFLQELIKKAAMCTDIDSLRDIETESASIYFSVFDDMILRQKNEFYFKMRNKRPPLDNVNAMLSFSYSLVANMCAGALNSVGLDPYVGFMHTECMGSRSLALDMLEEFRSVLCDRFVLTLINKRVMCSEDFEQREDGAVLFTDNGRKKFITAWQNRKREEIKHPFLGEKVQWGMLPYVQALLLARYINGELESYPSFMWK